MTVVDRPSLARPRIVGSPSGTDGEAHPLERVLMKGNEAIA